MAKKKPWKRYGLPPPKSEASKGELSLVDYEVYSGLEVPRKAFFVRLDGWCFHPLCKKLKLEEPYDKWFAASLVKTASRFFLPFNPELAYIFSDEINFLFLKNPAFRRIEKIDSVFAGLASSIFTNLLREKYKKPLTAVFDCRVIPVGKSRVRPYLIWRQAEAFRNHNNAWARHVLMRRGLSARAAAKQLKGLKVPQLRALAKKHGIDLDRTPPWQRAGILLHRETYKKAGWDPVKKKKVLAERVRVREVWNPPLFSQDKSYKPAR